ncbi:MAG TPA: hypothetical protein DDY43_00045 [Synechococcales bacterium UBA10510]|nr:hypothetical protein [Synechococcales bacterium UBA10510]
MYVSTGQSTTSGIGFAMGNLVKKSTTINMMLGWSEIQALERAQDQLPLPGRCPWLRRCPGPCLMAPSLIGW